MKREWGTKSRRRGEEGGREMGEGARELRRKASFWIVQGSPSWYKLRWEVNRHTIWHTGHGPAVGVWLRSGFPPEGRCVYLLMYLLACCFQAVSFDVRRQRAFRAKRRLVTVITRKWKLATFWVRRLSRTIGKLTRISVPCSKENRFVLR